MNQIIKSIVDFFWQLDHKQTKQILIGSLAFILILCGFILYLQFKGIRALKREMISVNKARIKTKEILEKNELIKKQQKRGEEILAQDKQFKIKEYMGNLVKQLKLGPNFKSDNLTFNELENLRSQGYEEVKMDADFINLNMKQLVDLLHELEQNSRIDVKKLEITKSKTQPTIDVQLTISTLQHKAGEEVETE